MYLVAYLKLSDLRLRAGFQTQRQLSVVLEAALGRSVSPATISSWERGVWPPTLTPQQTLIMCRILKCTLEELAEAIDNANSSKNSSMKEEEKE